MPVEREELLALAGFVPQNHERSVVQWSGIIRDDVDRAIQRGSNRSAWLHKKIHTQVNCAPFVRGIAARSEQWRSVNEARFIVAANPDGRAGALHLLKYFLRGGSTFRGAGIGAKKRAADAQIKNEARCRSQIDVQNRSRGARARFQPPFNFFTLRNGGKPASGAKSIVRETRMNLCKPLQGFPRGRFADGDVRIVRLQRLAICGIGDANGDPRADQNKKYGQLQLLRWKRALVSGHNRRRRLQ